MKRKGEEAEEVEKKKLKKNKKAKKKENSQPTEKGDSMESSFTSPEKQKKKKKADKEKLKKQKIPKESGWFEDDIEALLETLENMEEQAEVVCHKVPPEVWSSLRVGDHSPESCHTTWNKICHVVKTHLTIHHVVMIVKDMMHSRNNQKIMKLLVSKFPGAPTDKTLSAYQCFTKERLAETPPRSFKDIGVEWKALTDSERSRYQEKADKANKETKKKQEEFIQSLSEEMREKYLEQTPKKGQTSKSKSQKEFADAPKSTQSNGYQEYTKERFAEDPSITFTEIAAAWKSMSEPQKKPYQVRAVKINEEAKKELEKYVKSLTDEEQMRFFKSRKLTEKSKARVKKEKKSKGLGQRDFKRAELQYLKEEKKIAIKENPDLEEEEVLKRLSEAFRSLDYETQKSYCRKAEISIQEQKKITEFYKNFESPLAKTPVKSPKKLVNSAGKKKSEDDSSSDVSDVVPVTQISSPKKSAKRPPPPSSSSRDSSSSDDSSESEDENKGSQKTPVKSPKKLVNSAGKKKSEDDSSSDVSDVVPVTQISSPKKSAKRPPPPSSSSSDSSSSDDSSESEDENKGSQKQSGLTKTPQQTLKTSLNTSMKSISTPSSLKTLKKKQK